MTTLTGHRILVIEDSYLLAMEVKSALRNAGAEVIGPFATVENALKSLQQGLPDAAVLDINLGNGANSYDLARNLRMRCTPFVFFTGYDQNALPPEFADVERIEKPMDPTRLVRAVETCCRRASASLWTPTVKKRSPRVSQKGSRS